MTNQEFEEMSLIDHITELRRRLLWSFLYIIIIFVICFYFADQLFEFLAYPLVSLLDVQNGQGFIYTALQEAFFTELKIAFFFALFFAFPLIAVQIWKFIAPGLYNNEKKAWMLIKKSGCDKFYVGDAKISEKHCNFFVNNGKAKASDIEKLINKVKKEVQTKTGVNLELELQIIGKNLLLKLISLKPMQFF